MRDERWVDRFLFAWNDTVFFDPLDVYYEPRADHFLAGMGDQDRARFVRSGIWWSHRHNPHLPAQGWKIHVSAGHRDVAAVAAAVIGYLLPRSIDFKIALDLNIVEMLSAKNMSRGSSGKLLTIYPQDDEQFRTCLDDLAEIIGDAEGPYVLSDTRYKDSKTLYFRYGQFLDTHTVDVLGRRKPHILGPDGPVADDRQVQPAPPWWLPWPFPDWKPTDGPDGLLGGRFRVTGAVQFSNSGGVYTAEDTADGDRTVVLKEARPHTNVNPRRQYDAVDVLHREWEFLQRLADLGTFPRPVARFTHWEHHFIAEEHIDGTDIRSMLLERNPLARAVIEEKKSREFLRVFLAVLRELARAMRATHQRGVVLGDFTAANLLVDPDTLRVTIIDLESCRLVDPDPVDARLETSVELYTPGFSHSRRRFRPAVPEDDLYGLAMTMAYFIFPIAAMAYLRDDVLDLYRVFIDELGWPASIHTLLTDLAEARITLTEALDRTADEEALLDQVRREGSRPVTVDGPALTEVEEGVAAFVEAAADTGRDTLFPVDPFAHVTNSLSLGFGASGVLWALHESGRPLRPEWTGWLRAELAAIDLAEYPAGLMGGLAGIAWVADALGLEPEARQLLAEANRSAPAADHTYYYGLAGLGLANLRSFLCHRRAADLDAAQRCAQVLRDTAHREGGRSYWLNDFSADGPLTGLGFGQAGVALFLLRMSQVTGDPSYRELGREALAWEMAHTRAVDGQVMFEHRGTIEPYVEVGSAGVAKVLLRYGDLDAAHTLLRGLDLHCSVLPEYAFGMAGVADTLLDAAAVTGLGTYRSSALRQLGFIREVFLFEPAERFGMARDDQVVPLAMPGEGLLRCSCDYLTGSAGLLRVLHRANHGGGADFLLDEVDR